MQAAETGVKFAVYGGTDGTLAQTSAVAKGVAAQAPAFVIHTGNMADAAAPADQWQAAFDAATNPITNRSRLYPVREAAGPTR